MRKKKEKKDGGGDGWLATYSDMMTLLMVFFIMLIAFGDVKEVKTRIILSAFSGKLGFFNGGQSLSQSDDFETLGSSFESLPSDVQATNLNYQSSLSVKIFNPEVRSKRIRVLSNQEGVTISLFTDAFFKKDSARLNFSLIRETLENVRLLLDGGNFSQEILLEGHTDATPYKGKEFRDQWDLSTARAWAVLDALRRIPSVVPLDESRISIHGYASNRPIDSNDTPQGRVYNRRVDIVFKRIKND